METSKESIKQVFNSIDKDNSGSLDKNEIKQLAKELGQDLSDAELTKIFDNIDINKDGTISFEEFYDWWKFGKENKLEKLVYFKMKALKKFRRAQSKVEKIGGLLSNKYEKDISEHLIVLKCGDQPVNSGFKFRVLAGQEATQHTSESLNGHQDINKDIGSVVLRFKCTNPEQAKFSFENIFNQLKDLAEAFLPPQYVQSFLPAIKFSYATQDKYISIAITCDHEFVQESLAQYLMIAQMMLPPQISVQLELSMLSWVDSQIYSPNSTVTLADIYAKGSLFSLDLKLNTALLEQGKQLLIESVQEKFTKNNGQLPAKQKKFAAILPLFLISGSKIMLNFNSFDEGAGALMKGAEEKNLTLPQYIEMFKQSFQPAALVQEIPILLDFINLLKEQCESEFQLTVQVPNFAFVYEINAAPGLGQLVDQILSADK